MESGLKGIFGNEPFICYWLYDNLIGRNVTLSTTLLEFEISLFGATLPIYKLFSFRMLSLYFLIGITSLQLKS